MPQVVKKTTYIRGLFAAACELRRAPQPAPQHGAARGQQEETFDESQVTCAAAGRCHARCAGVFRGRVDLGEFSPADRQPVERRLRRHRRRSARASSATSRCISPKLPLQRSRSAPVPPAGTASSSNLTRRCTRPGSSTRWRSGPGIANGASVGGFEVKFSFLGAGSPPAAALRHQRCEFPRRLFGADDVTPSLQCPSPRRHGWSSSGWVPLQARRMRQHRQQLQSGSTA